MKNVSALCAALAIVAVTVASTTAPAAAPADGFDHTYRAYASMLRRYVSGDRVDYAGLKRERASLDRVVEQLGQVEQPDFESWDADEQIAYLLNAYNAFTLQAIVDSYPIDGGWLMSILRWAPRNSIKQIDGVWNERRWAVAGDTLTLDEIEHNVLRTQFAESRIHFALNCASVSCPRLRQEPYTATALDRQLMLAARDFLASDLGLQHSDETLSVSSLFSWFGEDFVDGYGHLVDGDSPTDRAVLGVIATYGPTGASQLAQSGRASLRFLWYDWSLNDIER